MYQISILKKSELSDLQDFIRSNWNENHVFVKSKELLLWQHGADLNINYLVARNESNEIVSVLGFIPTNHFSKKIASNGFDIWLALWKANPNYPGSGMDLLYHLQNIYKPNSIGSIGINKNVEKIYKILKYKTGKLNHFYYLNSKIKSFKIASIEAKFKLINKDISSNQKIEVLSSLSEINISLNGIYQPLKDVDYLVNRYEKHPFYNYKFWCIKKESENLCLLVVRKIEIEQSSCLRIVDVLGDLSKVENIALELDKILNAETAEYVDCINHGIDEEVFHHIGFLKNDGDVIIPNYFEPFLSSNNSIQFAYKSDFEPYVIFKGDSDQDRPNVLKNE